MEYGSVFLTVVFICLQYCLQYNDQYIVSGSADSTIRVWSHTGIFIIYIYLIHCCVCNKAIATYMAVHACIQAYLLHYNIHYS